MSKEMKILLGILGAIIAVAVVLTMLGKPPNLPLGPLKGVLAKDDPALDAAADPGLADPGLAAPTEDCVPATGAGADPATGATTTPDPATETGASTEPGLDSSTATGADTAATTGTPTCDDTGAGTDPGTGVDAGAGGTDPGTGTGSGGDAGTGTGAGAGTTPTGPTRATTDGTNSGNSPEALRIAADATGVMQKAGIQVSTTASLVPSAGGIGTPAAVRRYRATVTASTLVMQLDAAAQEQWKSAGAAVQRNLVRSFITRLGKSYRKASRSITVTDSTGAVLAVGDAAPGKPGAVKLF